MNGSIPDIRPATADDIPAIFHVRTSVIENHLTEEQLKGYGITRTSFAEAMVSGEMRVWCASVDEAVIGFVVAEPERREISALFVHPDAEGRGAGSQLLDTAVNALWALGDAPIQLYTGPETEAYAFYCRRGWVDQHHGPSDRPNSTDTCLELHR